MNSDRLGYGRPVSAPIAAQLQCHHGTKSTPAPEPAPNTIHPSDPATVFHVVLVQPEIPPNTGNVIRLCANTGCALHLIEPLGFPIDHAKMRRAGLDYHEFTAMSVHKNWAAFLDSIQTSMAAASGSDPQAASSQPSHSKARQIPFSGRLYGLSTSGHKSPYDHHFLPGDCLVFGRETSGLPDDVQDSLGTDHLLRLPMRPHNRSLNLSNAVAVTVFEAWRQQGFEGAASQ